MLNVRTEGSYQQNHEDKSMQRANGAKDIPRTHDRRLNEFEDEGKKKQVITDLKIRTT